MSGVSVIQRIGTLGCKAMSAYSVKFFLAIDSSTGAYITVYRSGSLRIFQLSLGGYPFYFFTESTAPNLLGVVKAASNEFSPA